MKVYKDSTIIKLVLIIGILATLIYIQYLILPEAFSQSKENNVSKLFESQTTLTIRLSKDIFVYTSLVNAINKRRPKLLIKKTMVTITQHGIITVNDRERGLKTYHNYVVMYVMGSKYFYIIPKKKDNKTFRTSGHTTVHVGRLPKTNKRKENHEKVSHVSDSYSEYRRG